MYIFVSSTAMNHRNVCTVHTIQRVIFGGKRLWFWWLGRESQNSVTVPAHTSGLLHCTWYRSGEFTKESTVSRTQYSALLRNFKKGNGNSLSDPSEP